MLLHIITMYLPFFISKRPPWPFPLWRKQRHSGVLLFVNRIMLTTTTETHFMHWAVLNSVSERRLYLSTVSLLFMGRMSAKGTLPMLSIATEPQFVQWAVLKMHSVP